jgi:RNA polymerase sigma-70 factor (ECF subfamily)
MSDPTPPTSLTLLQRLRTNESDAWALMVNLYTPLIYRWAARGGVTGADADDLAQEVLRAVAAALPNFRRDRAGDTFRGWLRGITRVLTTKHFSRQRRTPRASGGTDALEHLERVPDPNPDGEGDAGEDPGEADVLLRRALELVRGQFEPKTWEAFWLTAIEGRSPDAVAPALGVSAAAVRKYKSRVLGRLKSEFRELLE